MSYRKVALRLASLVALFVIASPGSFAQDPNDPANKPRNVKPELKKAYKDWLDKDVTYIITDEERKAFKKLANDDERERFIEEFWRRRDPDPDTTGDFFEYADVRQRVTQRPPSFSESLMSVVALMGFMVLFAMCVMALLKTF